MKTYRGILREDGERVVTVEVDGKDPAPLVPEIGQLGYAWGPPRDANNHFDLEISNGAARLALALLYDAFGGDQQRTMQFYMRIKSSVVVGLSRSGWTLTDAAVLAAVERSQQNWQETTQARTIAAQQPAPVAAEGGGGFVWHKDRRA